MLDNGKQLYLFLIKHYVLVSNKSFQTYVILRCVTDKTKRDLTKLLLNTMCAVTVAFLKQKMFVTNVRVVRGNINFKLCISEN